MLSKKNRVDKVVVDKIFKKGKVVDSPSLLFKFLLSNNHISPRISFITPKSVAKLAVKRNLLRRRGYIALAKCIDQFPTCLTGVMVYKKAVNSVSEIENEIKDILNKIN